MRNAKKITSKSKDFVDRLGLSDEAKSRIDAAVDAYEQTLKSAGLSDTEIARRLDNRRRVKANQEKVI